MATISQIRIKDATQMSGYSNRDIAAQAINVTVGYDSNDNIITDGKITPITEKNVAEALVDGLDPVSHASDTNKYGVASKAQYGHVKVGNGINAADGVISVSYGNTAGTAAAGNDSRLSDDRPNPEVVTFSNGTTKVEYDGSKKTDITLNTLGGAPAAHTSVVASANASGHVKLSDAYTGTTTESGLAASSAGLRAAYSELNSNLSEVKKSVSDGKSTVASAITSKGVTTASDATFATMATNISNIPNRNTDTYKPTSRSTSLDMGYNNVIRYVNTTSVPNTNSATFTPTSRTKTDLGETNAVRYVDTSGMTNVNSATFTPKTRAKHDMGETNAYRYVDTTSVPNTNSATFTPTSRANHDMGATNTYRYVNTNSVPNTNSATYTPSSNGSALDMGATNTYRYVNTNTVYNSGYNNGKTAGTPKASIGPWFCTGVNGGEFGCIYSQWAVGNYAHPCFCYGNDTGAGDNYHGDSPASNSYWTIINYDHHRLNITIAKACTRYDSNGNATSIAAGTTITGWESSNPYRYVWY